MRFELINPSDKIFLDAENVQVAQIAALYAGKGYYGLNDESGNQVFGMIAFGGSDGFFASFGGQEAFAEFAKSHKKEISDCLLSFRVNGVRSSLNDICGYAHSLAASLREARRGK